MVESVGSTLLLLFLSFEKVNEDHPILVTFVENKEVPSRDLVCEATSFSITAKWGVSVEFVAQKNLPSSLCHPPFETRNPKS